MAEGQTNHLAMDFTTSIEDMTDERLQEDLIVSGVCIDSLDPDSVDYFDKLQELERDHDRLEAELEKRRSSKNKRSRDSDEDTSDDSHRANKSHRTSPRPYQEPSPPFELPDDLRGILKNDSEAQKAQMAFDKMRQKELEIQARRKQELEDERLAKELESPYSNFRHTQGSGPQNRKFVPRNLVQHTLNRDGSLPPVRKQMPISGQQSTLPLGATRPIPHALNGTSHMVSSFPQAHIGANTDSLFDLLGPPSHDFRVQHMHQGLPTKQEGMVKQEQASLRGMSARDYLPEHDPHFLASSFPVMAEDKGAFALPEGYESNNSSDESLVEIDHNEWRPNNRTLERQGSQSTSTPHSSKNNMIPNSQLRGHLHPGPPRMQNGYGQSNVIDLTVDAPSTGRVLPWASGATTTGGHLSAYGSQLSQMRHGHSSGPPPMPGNPTVFGQMGSMAAGLVDSVRHGLHNAMAGPSTIAPPNPYSYLYSDPSHSEAEIKKLLANIRPDEDLPPELRKGTPDAMQTTLLEHQKLGLTWLIRQEEGTNKGGILADDMGLGKTIQAIALMVSRRSEDFRCKTNLIVAPVALLRQWESEIKDKVKARDPHQLTVFRHHGSQKALTFNELRKYDVVLTTYGCLTSEYKKKEEISGLKKTDPQVKIGKNLQLAILGDECKWYRVILDESQNIKNKQAICSKASHHIRAEYRLCMTGTPMMNTVDELYPMIRFCRIRPYCEWERFSRDISKKLRNPYSQTVGMKQLQALIRAVMLRRTKTSTLDGKPLIQLPERTVENQEVPFDVEEETFYRELEQKAQARVKNMLARGTLGKQYSNALVLLLRLRQACDHSHLVFFSESASTMSAVDASPELILELARELSEDVVKRLKEADGAFQCPICLDGTENPAILLPCGHTTCSECYSSLRDNAGLNDSEGMRCPVCRGDVRPNRITDFVAFKKIHQPELLKQQEIDAMNQILGENGGDSDSDSDSDGDEDSGSETESLDGFIVNDDRIDDDDDDDDETEDENEELNEHKKQEAKPPKKGNGKAKRARTPKNPNKGDLRNKSLAELKREGQRNKAARKRYFKKLEKFYKPSAKIVRTIEILDEVSENNPGEKVLIFSQFTSFLDLLEVGLRRANWKVARYDGSMSTDERAATVEAFKKERDVNVMLISLKAGNAGLNLNFASQVIILDPFWNPYIEEQAIDRAHRIGQMKNVNVHRVVVPGTVEDRILALQEKKRQTINKALDEQEGKSISKLGVRELAYLFGLDTRGNNITPPSRPAVTNGSASQTRPGPSTASGPLLLRNRPSSSSSSSTLE